MLRRLFLITMTTALLVSAKHASAQDAWPGATDRFAPNAGNGMWPPYGAYPPQTYGMYPTGNEWHRPGPIYNAQGAPMAETVYQYVPQGEDRGPFYNQTPLASRIQSGLRQAWVRVDYLNWSITDPGEALLGSPVIGFDVRNPIEGLDTLVIPFLPASDRTGTPRIGINGELYQAYTPDLSPFNFAHRNGMRTVIGIPTPGGTLEASAWSLAQVTDTFSVFPEVEVPSALGPPVVITIPVITLRINGQVPDPLDPFNPTITPMIPFDDTYHVYYQTELGGAEINLVHDTVNLDSPIRLNPMLGFRYTRLKETLTITGSDLARMINPTIRSESENHIFGPTVGLRLEAEHKHILLGAETKFTLGFNRHDDLVRTANLFEISNPSPSNPPTTAPPRQSAITQTDFAPITELQLYAQANINERLRLRIGYNLTTIFGVSRPYNNIVYTDSGVIDDVSHIVVSSTVRETFFAQGLFLSGELLLY